MISHQRQLSSEQSHFSYQTGEYSVHLRLCHPFAKEILNHFSILHIASDQFSMFHHASSGIRRIVTYTTERESFHFFCQWNRGNIFVSPLHSLILESSEHFAVNWNDFFAILKTNCTFALKLKHVTFQNSGYTVDNFVTELSSIFSFVYGQPFH